MRHVLVAIVVASCGTPAKPTPVHQPPPAPIDAGPVRPDAMQPIVHVDRARPVVEAPHGGAIHELAITSDGTTALTADELGGIRLWPKLDGSVEPRVVQLVRSRLLSIARRGPQFAVAAIDDVGGLEIARLDAGGVTVQHATLFGDLSFHDVLMTATGALAARSDQAVVQLDDNGVQRDVLGVEPGQQLVGIALAGARPYAMISKHAIEPVPEVDAGAGTPLVDAQFARFIDTTSSGLVWGDWIDGGVPLGATTVVSPTGRRLATLVLESRDRTQHLAVVDLATKQLLSYTRALANQHVAFVDDEHLAIATTTAVTMLDLSRTVPPQPSLEPVEQLPPQPRDAGRVEAAAGTAIASHRSELAITTVTGTQYLGYQLEAPQVAAAAPHGGLMIGVRDTFSLLDAQLKEVAQPTGLVDRGASVSQLRWLEGETWLVESAHGGGIELSLVDLKLGSIVPVRQKLSVVHALAYEPSTQLVTLSYGETPEVAHYDAEHHRLDKLASLAPPRTFEQRQLVPTRPELANGVQVVMVQLRDAIKLRWIKDPAKLEVGVLVEPTGSLAGTDAAGHVFVWQMDSQQPATRMQISVFQDGKVIGALHPDGSATIVPDPKGTAVLALGQRGVTLIGLDDTHRWTVPIEGTTEAHWLDDGGIALVGGGGLARVDATTGTVTAARCGWRFGLAARPHPVAPRIEPVCQQQLGDEQR